MQGAICNMQICKKFQISNSDRNKLVFNKTTIFFVLFVAKKYQKALGAHNALAITKY